jgi:hypothetical protein
MATFESVFMGAEVYNSANVTLTTGVGGRIPFDSEYNDAGGCHNNSVNNTRLTAPEDGTYLLNANVEFAANATGFRSIYFVLNNTDYLTAQDTNARASGATHIALSMVIDLVASDYVELEVYQNSGGNLDVAATAKASPLFSMRRIG